MMLEFFWTRTASIWIAILYMLLGLALLLFPGASGTIFVWALAAGAAVYGLSHLWRYIQSKRAGEGLGGDLFLGILPLVFALFALLRPYSILAFLPLVLGLLLLVDGVGKLPLVIQGRKARVPFFLPLLLSALLPILLGLLLVINPFQAAEVVIMTFGAALIIDGATDFATAFLSRKDTRHEDI